MVSFYSTSYRNKDSFIPSLFVNALTGMKGWEMGEDKPGEEKSTEEERREDCFAVP